MKHPSVTVVDYGVGNVGSLVNMVRRIGGHAELSRQPDELTRSTHIVLPGVGAFDGAADKLRDIGLVDALRAAVDSGAFLLGVCLGMQLLLDGSEEGVSPGLGLIPGICRRLPNAVEGEQLLVPHMGWSRVDRASSQTELPSIGRAGSRYYFVHSYYASPLNDEHVLGTTVYGVTFASAVRMDRVAGVQFHPEKSHRHGMEVLRDFLSQGTD